MIGLLKPHRKKVRTIISDNDKELAEHEEISSKLNAIFTVLTRIRHVESMKRDAICNLRHELYLDLRQNISEIKRNFRTSYKSLITSGSRMWIIGVLDSSGGKEGVWQEFRELHLKVSGRVTRSDETWAMQLHDIEQRRAFLIWLRNGSGEMVGGGLFSFTSDEGLTR